MTTLLVVVLLLLVALRVLGLPAGVCLLGGALGGGAMLFGGARAASVFEGYLPTLLTSDLFAGAVILLMVGAILQRTGTVFALPAGQVGRRGDGEGAAYLSGGALGLPLPLAASLIFAAVLTEVSIVTVLSIALWPGILLSLIYLAIYGISRPRRPHSGGTGLADGEVLAVIIRYLVPVSCLMFYVLPMATGIVTPTEAAVVTALVALIYVVILVAVLPTARGTIGRGFADAAAGTGSYLLILVALFCLSAVATFSQGPQALVAELASINVPPSAAAAASAVIGLIAGVVLGPLSTIGLVAILLAPALRSSGLSPESFAVLLFLLAEAIRVGPRLWSRGFLRFAPSALADDTLPDDPKTWPRAGRWPYYVAAVVVTLGYAALAPFLPSAA